MQHVLAGVLDLLVAQRARVPAGEARALAHAQVEQLVAAAPRSRSARACRRTRRRPACRRRCAPRCPRRGAAARRPGARRAARSRSPGRRARRRAGSSRGPSSSGSSTSTRLGPVSVGDRDLDQAQQRAVAALAHELGVDRQRAGLAGALGERGRYRGARHSDFSSGQRPVRSNSARAARSSLALAGRRARRCGRRRSAARPTAPALTSSAPPS